MKKLLLVIILFCSIESYSQTIQQTATFYNDGTVGKIRNDTVYTLPRTSGLYWNGYGSWWLLSDSVRSLLSATSPINYTAGVFSLGTVPIANGGTNNGSLSVTSGSIYYGDGSKIVALAPGTANQILHGGSTPSWKDTTAGGGGGGSVTASSTTTFTNKRWTARVGTTTSSATPTINTDNYDIYEITALTTDVSSFTTNLTGTPVDGDIFEVEITGTAARNIIWGSAFISSTVTLPVGTLTTATLSVIFQYFTTSSYGNNKWVCVNYF